MRTVVVTIVLIAAVAVAAGCGGATGSGGGGSSGTGHGGSDGAGGSHGTGGAGGSGGAGGVGGTTGTGGALGSGGAGGTAGSGDGGGGSLEGSWSFTTVEDGGTEDVTITFGSVGKYTEMATLDGCTETCTGRWSSTATTASVKGGSCGVSCPIMGMMGTTPCIGSVPFSRRTCDYTLSNDGKTLILTDCATTCAGKTVTVVLTR